MAKKARNAPFDKRLMCSVESLSYDFRTREGRLEMPDGNCCDMEGAVGLFTAIDPKAETIRTFAGGKPDTVYRKDAGDTPGWAALST